MFFLQEITYLLLPLYSNSIFNIIFEVSNTGMYILFCFVFLYTVYTLAYKNHTLTVKDGDNNEINNPNTYYNEEKTLAETYADLLKSEGIDEVNIL